MTGELLSLELIELKTFEHFIRLQNLKENLYPRFYQGQGHLWVIVDLKTQLGKTIINLKAHYIFTLCPHSISKFIVMVPS